MISSMTGYGRGEVTEDHTTVTAEIRTVNNRYLEVSARLPRTIALRENAIKELVRTKFARGKVNIAVTIEHENTNEIPLRINASAAKAYHKLLETLRAEVDLDEDITLDHLLKFPEILEIDEFSSGDEREWSMVQRAVLKALEETAEMRAREGSELMIDLVERIKAMGAAIDEIERMAKDRIPQERTRMQERVLELLADKSVLDQQRLELEIVLYAEKLDITEECVRFRSHNKFFVEALKNDAAAGRKLNFLVQEMNREANTIGAKANNAEIAHRIVQVKEELEKIREQLQNIE